MQIISHRGFWQKIAEKNSKEAFIRSFNCKMGTETDLRDNGSSIVISHDMPKGGELSFEEVLKIMDGRNLPLALNIKADGLAYEIKSLLTKYCHTNYFTFDMSIPDMLQELKAGLRVYTGISDIMPSPVLADKTFGVWLDSFYTDWFDTKTLDDIVKQYGNVCIVSADLHKRDVENQWNMIKKSSAFTEKRLMLCTDNPKKAKEYFYGKN